MWLSRLSFWKNQWNKILRLVRCVNMVFIFLLPQSRGLTIFSQTHSEHWDQQCEKSTVEGRAHRFTSGSNIEHMLVWLSSHHKSIHTCSLISTSFISIPVKLVEWFPGKEVRKIKGLFHVYSLISGWTMIQTLSSVFPIWLQSPQEAC